VAASAARNCAHNSEKCQELVMTAAVRAVVVKPGVQGGSVIVAPVDAATAGDNDAATAGDLPALANAAFDLHLTKNHCACCE